MNRFQNLIFCLGMACAILTGCKGTPNTNVAGTSSAKPEVGLTDKNLAGIEAIPAVSDTLFVGNVTQPTPILPLHGIGEYRDSLIGLGESNIIGRFPFPNFSLFVIRGNYWYDLKVDSLTIPDSDILPKNTEEWPSTWLMTYRNGLLDTLPLGVIGTNEPYDHLWYKIDNQTMGLIVRTMEIVDQKGTLKPYHNGNGSIVKIASDGQMTIHWGSQ